MSPDTDGTNEASRAPPLATTNAFPLCDIVATTLSDGSAVSQRIFQPSLHRCPQTSSAQGKARKPADTSVNVPREPSRDRKSTVTTSPTTVHATHGPPISNVKARRTNEEDMFASIFLCMQGIISNPSLRRQQSPAWTIPKPKQSLLNS